MTRRGVGPNVTWVGLIVRTDDGQVHAVELDQYADGNRGLKITADLILTKIRAGAELDITAVIRGRGRYWREGENLGPDVQPRRMIGGKVQQQLEAQRRFAIDNNLIIEGY